jgi:hypothetical protein
MVGFPCPNNRKIKQKPENFKMPGLFLVSDAAMKNLKGFGLECVFGNLSGFALGRGELTFLNLFRGKNFFHFLFSHFRM